MANRLVLWISVGLAAGIGAGFACHQWAATPEQAQAIAGGFSILTDLFLRAIKMIIAPLVLSTLISGVAHFGEGSALGRIGVRTLLWFLAASLVSLALGLVLVNLLQPGAGLNLPLPAAGADAGVTPQALSLRTFITHLVPKSIVEAMAGNDILPIVVFSLFAGVALGSLGERGAPLLHVVEALAQVMLRMTGYVMLAAPVAVFAAVAAVVTTQGLGVLVTYGKFIASFYLGLALLWALLGLAAVAVLGRRGLRLIPQVREPLLLAFSTASSEAAYPKTLERLEAFGVPKRIASFVLPLGYSFNLDGSMMYCTFATLFIAQAYGIELGVGQQITMLLLLMVTSKGMAGVPRASLVVIAATLVHFDIPEAGLLLILGVDQFLDMGRSATNVIGNTVASAVIARWEGALGSENARD